MILQYQLDMNVLNQNSRVTQNPKIYICELSSTVKVEQELPVPIFHCGCRNKILRWMSAYEILRWVVHIHRNCGTVPLYIYKQTGLEFVSSLNALLYTLESWPYG